MYKKLVHKYHLSDNTHYLEYCLLNHFDEKGRSNVCVFVGRWVDCWDGPYMVPSVDFLCFMLENRAFFTENSCKLHAFYCVFVCFASDLQAICTGFA